ncbi:hypothetical protein ACFY93_09525 [Streptomyces sp. NPDC008313]|uniref:hypothetical protein n=1 Tax=Streptomyces sp. NPDC008313 TaxID=3364826 RepID=UPI0036EB5DD5
MCRSASVCASRSQNSAVCGRGPQHGHHEQIAVRDDHLGRVDAARLAQHGEPFRLRGEGVVGRRLAERLDEHGRAVTAPREPRGGGEAPRGGLDLDDVGQTGRVQAFEQEGCLVGHGCTPHR